MCCRSVISSRWCSDVLRDQNCFSPLAPRPRSRMNESIESTGSDTTFVHVARSGQSIHSSASLRSSSPSLNSEKSHIQDLVFANDWAALQEIAYKSGFQDKETRRIVWPYLLQVQFAAKESSDDSEAALRQRKGKGKARETEDIAPVSHKDEHQVALDVNRSFIHFPQGQLGLTLPLLC